MWRKSSFCNGAAACLETAWVTASCCNNGNCVAVTCTNGEIWVRDSKNPDGNVLCFTVGSWWSFIAAIKSGKLDELGDWDQPIRLAVSGSGPCEMWRADARGVVLVFDREEIAAFVDGVRKREFDPDALAKAAPTPATEVPRRPLALPLAGVEGDPLPA